MNINQYPARAFSWHDIESGVFQVRQPYVRPIGFLNEGPKQIWICNVFGIERFLRFEWVQRIFKWWSVNDGSKLFPQK